MENKPIKLDPRQITTKENFIDIKPMGFKPPEIKPADYFFGSAITKIPDKIINNSGQWLDYLPTKESQYKIIKDGDKTYYVEPFGCTGFGSNNVWEILHLFLYQQEVNLSDRAINILAGNTKTGNNPENPMEVLRKIGVCSETSLPYDNSCINWEAFHSPKPLPDILKAKCKEMLDKYDFMHEWVLTANKDTLWEALKRSPLGISVLAWQMRNGMYYKNKGESDNHWVVLIGGEYGKFWYVFDSYDNYIKKLEWEYDFRYAKRCYLKKKLSEEPIIPPEENPMKCYQNKGTPNLFFLGEGDKKYHWVPDMSMAKAIWTNEEIANRLEMVIASDYRGETYYPKQTILGLLVNALSNFFKTLKGKK